MGRNSYLSWDPPESLKAEDTKEKPTPPSRLFTPHPPPYPPHSFSPSLIIVEDCESGENGDW